MVLYRSFIYGLGLKSNPSVVGYFHDVHATVGHVFARPAVIVAHGVDGWVSLMLAFIDACFYSPAVCTTLSRTVKASQ